MRSPAGVRNLPLFSASISTPRLLWPSAACSRGSTRAVASRLLPASKALGTGRCEALPADVIGHAVGGDTRQRCRARLVDFDQRSCRIVEAGKSGRVLARRAQRADVPSVTERCGAARARPTRSASRLPSAATDGCSAEMHAELRSKLGPRVAGFRRVVAPDEGARQRRRLAQCAHEGRLDRAGAWRKAPDQTRRMEARSPGSRNGAGSRTGFAARRAPPR